MPDIGDVTAFLADEHGLAVISTTQADGRVLSSVANCGPIRHPVTGAEVVTLVSAGGAARLAHIRRGSELTIAVRRGWRWVAVTGPAEIIGPDDPVDGLGGEDLRLLLRGVFQAAGGTHEDYDQFDRVMVAERRAAVLVTPGRIIGTM